MSETRTVERADWPAADTIHVSTSTQFGWRDRVRILLSGHIVTRVLVDTEHLPGNTRARETMASTRSPLWRWHRWRQPQGLIHYGEAEAEQTEQEEAQPVTT